MSENDPLFLWRLAEDLSVEDAAILIAGGDPSEVDYEYPQGFGFGEGIPVKRTTGHPNFAAAFSALKAAVIKRHIPTTFQFRGLSTAYKENYPIDRFHVISKSEFLSISNIEVDIFNPTHNTIVIDEEPDWSATFVKVDDLVSWLRSRGHTTGFFFQSDQPDPDEFMDNSHEHFAPELALAVAAWRALAEKQRFPRGPKAAIAEWIDQNPDEWKGAEPLSNHARERIMTLVNWKRGGGANPTGG